MNKTSGITLNKYLALSGVASRRLAVSLIKEGNVSVNNTIVREPGYRVVDGIQVKCKGRIIAPERKLYIVLNKPRGYITTVKDEHGRKTVLDLFEETIAQRIYPVGRLDAETTGVLLLTNDGDFSQSITHPKNAIRKVYDVELDKPLSVENLEQIKRGIHLYDGFIQVDDIEWSSKRESRHVRVTLHSGKYRIVRRIFEYFSYRIVALDRIAIAHLSKKGISKGSWRFLTAKEYAHFMKKKSACRKEQSER